MFQVEIKNLKTKAHIGIIYKERQRSQPLTVTLRFQYNVAKISQLDDIKYLKDYSAITKSLKLFIETSRYKSLEKLIVECSKEMKKKFKLNKVYISINKVAVVKRYGCESLRCILVSWDSSWLECWI
jgi:FolB domain-containing protein